MVILHDGRREGVRRQGWMRAHGRDGRWGRRVLKRRQSRTCQGSRRRMGWRSRGERMVDKLKGGRGRKL